MPAFHRSFTVPFAFQDGRFNLIQPVNFQHVPLLNAINRACLYAVEGGSLFEHPDERLGELQLIVVGDFEPTQEEAQMVVKDILVENQVSFFTLPELPRSLRAV